MSDYVSFENCTLTHREIRENCYFLINQWKAEQKARFDRTYLRAQHMGIISYIDEHEVFLAISRASQRCEKCDARRMAACPMPHCKFRRMHIDP